MWVEEGDGEPYADALDLWDRARDALAADEHNARTVELTRAQALHGYRPRLFEPVDDYGPDGPAPDAQQRMVAVTMSHPLAERALVPLRAIIGRREGGEARTAVLSRVLARRAAFGEAHAKLAAREVAMYRDALPPPRALDALACSAPTRGPNALPAPVLAGVAII